MTGEATQAAGRLPTAVLMSGAGSNARKLLEYAPPEGGPPAYDVRLIVSDNPGSNFRGIAEAFGVEAWLHDIREFCGASPGALRDPERRRAYDLETLRILEVRGIGLVAAAGYDWVISPELCRAFPIVNVHPGDLRVRDPAGRRRYVGLGWIPTAKAILAGEETVRATTHLVTPELDGGPIARVSRPVAVDLPPGSTPANILPAGATLGDVLRDQREGGRRFGEQLIVRHARRIQERLKEAGDWVEFPYTLHRVAGLLRAGRLAVDDGIALDGLPVRDLFLQEGSPQGSEGEVRWRRYW